MLAVGLVAAAFFGLGVTGWCDRKGLHRIPVKAMPGESASAPVERNALTPDGVVAPNGAGYRPRKAS